MRQTIVALLALTGAIALVVGGIMLWNNRPGRVAISVNGRVITDRELTWRAQTLIDDAKRVEHLLIPEKEMPEAMRHYRRTAAKMWIVKEVLLAAAVESGVKANAADEKESLAKMERQLKSRNLTPEQFFKEGPIPEEIKREDFRESVLIAKFTRQDIEKNISVSAQEVENRMRELLELKAKMAKAGDAAKVRTDRRGVIDMLRQEHFNKGFRDLFRTQFGKMTVECPAFPDLESVDAVSPPR